MSAFVQTPFLIHRSPSRQLCMTLPANRYNPFVRRSSAARHIHGEIKPRDPSLEFADIPPSIPPSNGTGSRPDRPENEDSDEATMALHEEADKLKFYEKWPALHNRLLANPRLPLQLGVELFVGFVSKTLAEVQDRGDKFFKEFDHYLCNLSLELVGDAMLVWLLSPIAGGASRLPKHFLQIGGYSLGQRVIGFVNKGLQFGVVGIASSAVGQGVTRMLVKARGGDTDSLPQVWPNCLAWGGFLLLSSNTRYQLINGFEQRVMERLLPGGAVGAGVTFVVRFGNCYLGGIQWLPWARFLGVQ